MKKSILSLSLMMMMVSSLFTFTSCGDDDSNTPAEEVKEATIKEVLLVMTAYPTDDMLKYADLSITLSDEKGDTVSGIVTAEKKVYNYTIKSFPASVSIKYNCAPKEGVAPEDDATVSASRSFTVNKYYVMSDGTKKLAGTTSGSVTGGVDMFGRQLRDYLLKNPVLKEVNISFDEDKKIK